MGVHFGSVSRSVASNTTSEARVVEETIRNRMQKGIAIDRASHSEFFRLLRDMPNPFKKPSSRSTSLFYLAIREGYTLIVRGLIEFAKEKKCLTEAMIEFDEAHHLNALHMACEQRHSEEGNLAIVSMLLEAGASLFALNRAGLSPLHLATCYQKTKITETMIQYAQKTYPQKIVSELLDLRSGHPPHETALHMACVKILGYAKDDQSISLLLEAGASPFVLNSYGLSPLYTAVSLCSGNEKAVENILRHAKENGYLKEILEQKNGPIQSTAREEAERRNFEKIAAMLLQAEYHVKDPRVFPLFSEKPPLFPDLDRNDMFYSSNCPTGAVGHPFSFS